MKMMRSIVNPEYMKRCLKCNYEWGTLKKPEEIEECPIQGCGGKEFICQPILIEAIR